MRLPKCFQQRGPRLCISWTVGVLLLGTAGCDCATRLQDVNAAASPGMFSLFGTPSGDSGIFSFERCEYAATSVFVYKSTAGADDLDEARRNATFIQEVESQDGQPVHVPLVDEQTLVVCIVDPGHAQDACAAVRPGPERKVTASRRAYDTCVISDSGDHACVRSVDLADPSDPSE